MQTNIQPVAWTVAGSDSGGGAGIQADLKTMNALGVYGCSVITALTAQNTLGVSRIEYPSLPMLQAQLRTLVDDLPPAAVKLGMLGDAEAIRIVVDALRKLKAFIVCDPVMISTHGNALLSETAIQVLKTDLLPGVTLLTPNQHEVERLLGRYIQSPAELEQAAMDLLALGASSVLLKGGHQAGDYSQDFYTDGQTKAWLTSPRQHTRHHHGTGCVLSAAITACIALGYEPLDAIVIAKAYVNQGLRQAPRVGRGYGPLAHLGWPETYEDMPWLTRTAEGGQNRLEFPDCGPERLGFYPVVDRAAWVEKLLPMGVSTIQLRIKDMTGVDLEREIARAAICAEHFRARLFVNDYWELALKYRAYGVHLGQEDLETADLRALMRQNIRLGLSTHCYREVARALALRPSYMAIGPIFPTTTKPMRFAPQGLENLRRWRRTLPYPLVAIGGICLQNAPEVLATGADGVAVVRDIMNSPDVSAQTDRWLELLRYANDHIPLRGLPAKQSTGKAVGLCVSQPA